jgi:hypothetical protein
MKPIRAQPVPPTDKMLRWVKDARASDQRKGTGPVRNTPKPYVAEPALDVAPDVEAAAKPDTGLQAALHSIGSELLKGGDTPVTMDQLGFAFRHAASQLGTGEEPDDRGGLFNTPSPEREAS